MESRRKDGEIMSAKREEDEEEELMDVEDEEEEDEEEEEGGNNGNTDDVLKRRISTHPLYGKLVQIHLNCLKIGVVSEVGRDLRKVKQQQLQIDKKPRRRLLHRSDLDQFMEAYCVALSELREAIEEPQQESMDFITSMHSQLQEMEMEMNLTTTATAIINPHPTNTTTPTPSDH